MDSTFFTGIAPDTNPPDRYLSLEEAVNSPPNGNVGHLLWLLQNPPGTINTKNVQAALAFLGAFQSLYGVAQAVSGAILTNDTDIQKSERAVQDVLLYPRFGSDPKSKSGLIILHNSAVAPLFYRQDYSGKPKTDPQFSPDTNKLGSDVLSLLGFGPSPRNGVLSKDTYLRGISYLFDICAIHVGMLGMRDEAAQGDNLGFRLQVNRNNVLNFARSPFFTDVASHLDGYFTEMSRILQEPMNALFLEKAFRVGKMYDAQSGQFNRKIGEMYPRAKIFDARQLAG